MQNFVNITLSVSQGKRNIMMEKGCYYENNGGLYYLNDKGELSVFDKLNTKKWVKTDTIKMTEYQYKTLKAVANNVDEKKFKDITLSKSDIDISLNQYGKGELRQDIEKELSGYKVGEAKKYSLHNAFTVYITNGEADKSANLIFGYGKQENAKTVSEISAKNFVASGKTENSVPQVKNPTQSSKPTQPSKPEVPAEKKEKESKNEIDKYTPYIDKTGLSKNIKYSSPLVCEVSKELNTGVAIARHYGVSLCVLVAANPKVDWDALRIGQKIIVPERLKVEQSKVKTLDSVSETTGFSKEYLNDIIVGIEQLHTKVYNDKYGTLTIGYGHTGEVSGNPLTTSTQDITEAQACGLLAQDLMDAKIATISYFGKEIFDKAPQMIQEGLIDITFNKGISKGFQQEGTSSSKIKQYLEEEEYAKVVEHLVYDSPSPGLRKRNICRVIMASAELTPEERKTVLENLTPEYEATVKALMSNSPGEAKIVKKAWENAKNGKTTDFFGE